MARSLTQLNDDTLLCILGYTCDDLITASSIPLVSKRLLKLCKNSDRYVSTLAYLNLRLHHAYGFPSIHSTESIREYTRKYRLLNHNLSSDPAKLVSHQTHHFTLDVSWYTQHVIISNFIFFLEDVPARKVRCYDMDRAMAIVWECDVRGNPYIEANLNVDVDGDAPPSIVRLLISQGIDTIVTIFQLQRLPEGGSTLTEKETHRVRIGDNDVGSISFVNEWILLGHFPPGHLMNTDTGDRFPIETQDDAAVRTHTADSFSLFPSSFQNMILKCFPIDSRHLMCLLRSSRDTNSTHLAIYQFPKPSSDGDTLHPIHLVEVPKLLSDIVPLDTSSFVCDGESDTGVSPFTQTIAHIIGCDSEERLLVDISLPHSLNANPVVTTKSFTLGDNERGDTNLGQYRRRIYRQDPIAAEFSFFQAALGHHSRSATYQIGKATRLESPNISMGTRSSSYVDMLAFDDVRGRVYLVVDLTPRPVEDDDDEPEEPEFPRHYLLHILDYV